jgi:hypothetical protein
VAASGISGKQGKGKGKRKRGGGSVRSGTVKGAADGRSATGRQEEDEEEEVDGEDEGDDGVVDAGAKVDKAQEKRKLAYVTLRVHLQQLLFWRGMLQARNVD